MPGEGGKEGCRCLMPLLNAPEGDAAEEDILALIQFSGLEKRNRELIIREWLLSDVETIASSSRQVLWTACNKKVSAKMAKKKRQFGSTENAAERGGGSKISKIMWKYLLESGQIFKIKKEENKFVSHIITSIHVSLMFHLGPKEHSCLLS